MKNFRALLVCVLLAGCIATPDLWGSAPVPLRIATAAPTLVPTEIPPVEGTAARAQVPTVTFTPTPTYLPAALSPTLDAGVIFTPVPDATLLPAGIQRVLIISYDGLRPDAIPAAPMTNLLALIQKSAYSFSARTIPYSATLPSHASMISGLCMEKHGVIYDRYFLSMGYSKGVDIFDLAHAAGLRTAMVVSKDKLRELAEPETTDVFDVSYGEAYVARSAVEQIKAGFGLMLVHFAGADLRGHKYGWMSSWQFKVLRQGDDALGTILTALDEAGLRETTLVIVTADHGGHDKDHNGTNISDYLIPWIISGPGIVPGELKTVIQTMDTAATSAYALKLPLQADWDGIPVYEAFGMPTQKAHGDKVCK